MEHIVYRVCVDNYHAQLKLGNWTSTFATKEEALSSMLEVERIHDAIDDELVAAADAKASYEDENEKWERVYSDLWEEKRREILREGWEDGDGHRYFIREEDDRAPLLIVSIRSFYGPEETWAFVRGRHDYPEEFDTLSEAMERVQELESEQYVLAHNEASRPEYVIVSDDVRWWLKDDDCGKFDWPEGDEYDETSPYYDEDRTSAKMREMEIRHIRDNAI